jgi:FlaA1/EpsC-like NDP-sugar epimerase
MLDPALEAEGLGTSAFSAALDDDWSARRPEGEAGVQGGSVLVVGAAGTIGAASVRQLLELAPARLELIDIDENGLARLARDVRSRGLGAETRIGFNPLDFAAWPGLAFVSANGPFDLVLNFAAVKHVRSEKNLFTLLHMIGVNVVAQQRFAAHLAREGLALRHFVVSTDKAAEPASFMGATKRLLEALAFAEGERPGAPKTTAARFANVAYSSGSLLESYLQRFTAGQALAAPKDTRRYFIAAREAARICLLGEASLPRGRLAIPRFDPASGAMDLAETAAAFVRSRGRRPVFVETAEEAQVLEGADGPDYPILLTPRDTAGEKEVEVFRGAGETAADVGLASLEALAPAPIDGQRLAECLAELAAFVSGERTAGLAEIEAAISRALPEFRHQAGAGSLDDRI